MSVVEAEGTPLQFAAVEVVVTVAVYAAVANQHIVVVAEVEVEVSTPTIPGIRAGLPKAAPRRASTVIELPIGPQDLIIT